MGGVSTDSVCYCVSRYLRKHLDRGTYRKTRRPAWLRVVSDRQSIYLPEQAASGTGVWQEAKSCGGFFVI